LNMSPSVPVGFYWLTAVPLKVDRGTFVLVSAPLSIQHVWPSWVPLLKPVAAIPGDMVCAQEAHLLVNRVDYGPIVGTHNRPLPHLDPGCQTVPEGMVLLASPVPKSLDGTLFRLVPCVHTDRTGYPCASLEITI
jgi:type IV secretory pathway protease TraF